MSQKLRIVHIINSFEFGGAEAMLCNLLLRTDRTRFDPMAVSLIDDLTVAGPIVAAGIPIVTMKMRPGVPDPLALARLVRYLRRVRPAIVQTWMDHSNLIGGLAASAASTAPIVWGIHHSFHVRGTAKRSTLMTVSACALLSTRVPSRIVCCSRRSRDLYALDGFAPEKLMVIPNGIDTRAFRPDPQARLSIRSELGLDPDATLIGLVARYDPLKDHATFLQAAAQLLKKFPRVRFLLCGANVDWRNVELVSRIAALGLTAEVCLLGPRRDMSAIQAALDIATSSSISEAFPLAVGEAMSCAAPCVATDVGDSAFMLGETGRIVAPRDPLALAAAWTDLLMMGRDARANLGLQARRRVCELFDLDDVSRRYQELYQTLASRRHANLATKTARPRAEQAVAIGW